MAVVEVKCPKCESTRIIKHGRTAEETYYKYDCAELDYMWSFVQNKGSQR